MMPPEPRLMTGREADAYCNVTQATWAKWVASGIVPLPLPGTRCWDRKAIDLALDKLSGLEAPAERPEEDVGATLATWKAENEVRKNAARAEAEWERKYEARKARRPR